MSLPDGLAVTTHHVDRVAYAIGKVIAKKTIANDPPLRRLDALGRASAEHTLAEKMIPDLREEARAAVDAVLGMLAEGRVKPAKPAEESAR